MHLEQLPSGSWRASERVAGRRLRATARTKHEARLRLAELIVSASPSRPKTGTLDDLLSLYVAQLRIAPTTIASYRRVIEQLRQADVALLGRQVDDIAPVEIRGLYRELGHVGWTPHRLQRVHAIVSGAFRHAVADLGWLRANPAHGAGPEQPDPPELHVPTDDDVRAIIAAALELDDPAVPDHQAHRPGVGRRLALAVRLAATIGLRRGETVALQWDDIDLTAGRVQIRRSLSYTPSEGVRVGSTKTGAKGHRAVTISSPTLLGDLRRHRTDQRADALGHGMAGPVWVVSDDAGHTPWRPDRFTALFEAARARAGVDCRLHDLRHYCATTLLMAGVAPSIVAGILGHTTTATTLRRYAHYLPGVDGGAAAIMASRLG